MSLTANETPVAVPPVTQHPTPCPSWCMHRHAPMRHNCTPRDTVHQSVSLALAAPGGEVLVRAELFRLDELSDVGDTGLWIEGATSVELGVPEGDIFIAQVQAFMDGMRVLCQQMGGVAQH